MLLDPVFGSPISERLGTTLRFNGKYSRLTYHDMIHVERRIAADVVKDTKPVPEELVEFLADSDLGLVPQRQPSGLANQDKGAVHEKNDEDSDESEIEQGKGGLPASRSVVQGPPRQQKQWSRHNRSQIRHKVILRTFQLSAERMAGLAE
ncbi:MAG: hypothetical protein M3O41_05490 [Pseudomonadota bacterium]|nr:hypothetical protein [Pseudomonadota bacterium]